MVSQVAELGGGAEHRDDQPLALDRPDQVGGELADPGGELAAAVGEQLERRLDLLGGPILADRSKEDLLAQLNSLEGHRETHKFPLKTMSSFLTVPEHMVDWACHWEPRYPYP